MHIQNHVSLRHLNTFGLDAEARYFTEARSVSDLEEILLSPDWKDYPKLILGGGSNVLFTRDVNALVIRPTIRGIEKVREDKEFVWIHAGAGEVWEDFVEYCVDLGYAGVENLSLIPGTVGAAPMQNIGAYGVEIRDVVENVEAVALKTGEARTFTWEECRFGYRESVFKRTLRDQYIITGVTFRLNKNPVFKTDYGDIQKVLCEKGVEKLTVREVSNAVIDIRKSKLPDPKVIGNAGSFFKNPEIPQEQYDALKMQYPEIPGYSMDGGQVKVPAGWLIERAGWKGYRENDIGVHARQALVLVNYGGGTGAGIKALAEKIQDSVENQYGIRLTAEVNFI